MTFEWSERKNKANKKKMDEEKIDKYLKKMTFEELKNLPPLMEEELRIIREAKPTPTEDCPKQTKEELAKFRPWYEVHPDFYKPKKTEIHMRVDSDVLAWFKKQGKGYQTEMNAVLRRHAFGAPSEEKKQKKILVPTRIDEDAYKEFAARCDDEGCILEQKLEF